MFYKKKQWRPPSKKKKRGKNLSPRDRKACHSVSTALVKSVAKIETLSCNRSLQAKKIRQTVLKSNASINQLLKKWKPSSDKKRKASPCPKAGRTAFCN
jgi:hypothetical protein